MRPSTTFHVLIRPIVGTASTNAITIAIANPVSMLRSAGVISSADPQNAGFRPSWARRQSGRRGSLSTAALLVNVASRTAADRVVCDVPQPDRRGVVVVQRNGPGGLICRDFRRERHFALSRSRPIQPQLDEGERIVAGSGGRPRRSAPHAEAPIGQQNHTVTARRKTLLVGIF